MPEPVCEHCGQQHLDDVSFCPITGKITHPERFFPRGTVIGDKYRLGPVLGSGGMGAVFEATHTMLQKRVAVKLMLPEMAKDRELMARMVREARTASATGHRNVVLVTDMGWTEHGALFLVMEYLEGRTLRELMRDEGPQPVERAARIIFQVLSGLIAVHEHGIVHRDLKPDNVMVIAADEGEELVKLLDFGISKVLQAEQVVELTRTGSVLGSPRYMSPEQARGLRVDARTDIYSVGGIFYSLLAGRPPLRAKSYSAMIAAILKGEIEPPSTYAPDISEAVDALVLKALATDVEQRFADARAFRQALRPLLAADQLGLALQRGEEGNSGTLKPPAAPAASSTSSHDVSLGSLARTGDPEPGTLELASSELDPTALDASQPAPAHLTGSGLVEPATAPGARFGDTDTQATKAVRPSAVVKRASAPSREVLATTAVEVEEDRPVLEPLASSVGVRIEPQRGGELELDIEDRWRQQQADKHGAGLNLGPPPQVAGARRAEFGLGKVMRLLAVLAVLAALALWAYAERQRIGGWFGVQVAPDTVLLLVETHPPRAQVRVDGVTVVDGSLQLPRSDAVHHLKVSAPGYHTKEVTVRSNTTRRVMIRLRKR